MSSGGASGGGAGSVSSPGYVWWLCIVFEE